jgi:hypothetical protein
MSAASFHEVISEHLALRERNKRLEREMPLDEYRQQVGGGSITRPTPRAPAQDEFETETVANTRQEHWFDPGSSWDTTGERPMPEFDWGDA